MLIVLGTDVSKKKLDNHLFRHETDLKGLKKSVSNDAQGFSELVKWIEQKTGASPTQIYVVMEATGPYHEAFAETMHQLGAAVVVANPTRVKHFGQSEGIRTKNDQIDARLLACYARKNPTLRRWKPTPEEYRQLEGLIKRRETLEADRQRERNRYEKVSIRRPDPQIKASFERAETFLNAEIAEIDQQIEQLIEQHPTLQRDRKLLRSIPGVGPVIAVIMLALLQHGERFDSAPQLAAYLGLNPVGAQSGTSVHQPAHLSKVGPARWRAKLYLPAVVASQHNPDVRDLYQRLVSRGKSKMSAIGAAMRKIVHICFGVIKNQSVYQPQISA
jgi:transposase